MISQASRPQWGTDEVCEMQVPLGSGEGPSASDMSPQQEDPLSCIRACCMCRPQAEAQKLSFLASICTICEAALEDSGAHYRLCVCPLEVAQCIEELLQEEPAERLDTELRQQAMNAIAAMSRAWLLPEERKSSLLRACLGSVLHLPRHEDTQDRDAALYMETMEALHRLLQVLVGSAGTSVLMELQNILEVWLRQGWDLGEWFKAMKGGIYTRSPQGPLQAGGADLTSDPCSGHTSSFSLHSSCCPSPRASWRPWRRGPWRALPGCSPSATPAPCPR